MNKGIVVVVAVMQGSLAYAVKEGAALFYLVRDSNHWDALPRIRINTFPTPHSRDAY